MAAATAAEAAGIAAAAFAADDDTESYNRGETNYLGLWPRSF